MSSSDSDEDSGLLNRFSEAAVDPHKHLNLKPAKGDACPESRPVSKRGRGPDGDESKEVEANNLMRVKVTPQFQDFMARKLSQALEATMEETPVEPTPHHCSQSPTPEVQDGIRLFAKSRTTMLRGDEEQQQRPRRSPPRTHKRKKKLKTSKEESGSSSSDLDEELIRESAVDCDWVLQKKGAYPDDRQRTAPVDVINKII